MKRLQFALVGAMLFAWTCAAQAQMGQGPMGSPYGNPQMMGQMGSPYGNPMMGSMGSPYGPPQAYGAQQAAYMMQGDPQQGMLYGNQGGPMPMGGGAQCECGTDPNCANCCDDGAVHYGYLTAEAFYARRTNQAFNQPLITDLGATIVDVHDASYIYEPGGRITAGYFFSQGFGLEGSAFGEFDFHGGLFASDPGAGLSAPGTAANTLGGGSNDFDAVTNMAVTYRSQIRNGEVNLIIPYGSIQFLSGLRFMQDDEIFDLSGGTGQTSDYVIHTHNNLYGSQLGVRGQWQIWRLTFDVGGKAGYYENYTNQEQSIGDNGNTTVLRDATGSKSVPAFVGEVNANTTWAINDWLTARFGYTAVWMQEVALAPSQLDFDLDHSTNGYVNTRSGILLHGFTAGFEAKF